MQENILWFSLMMQQLEYMLAFYDTGTYNDQPLSSVFPE